MNRYLIIIVLFLCTLIANPSILLAEPERLVSYTKTVVFSDVKGNWQRLEYFLHHSEAFEYDPSDGFTLKADYKFVFMGDAISNSTNVSKILATLVEMKRNAIYSGRADHVQIILGNQDVKKFGINFDNVVLSRYMNYGQRAHLDRLNRTLFIRGGLGKDDFKQDPFLVGKKMSNIEKWVESLNLWIKKNSHVVNSKLSVVKQIIPENLQEALLRQGIDTVVVGHLSVGEVPLLISNNKFRVVFIDNSTAATAESAQITLFGKSLKVSVRSPRDDFSLDVEYEHILGESSTIGRKTKSGWIVGERNGKSLVFRVEKDSRTYNRSYEIIDTPSSILQCGQIF